MSAEFTSKINKLLQFQPSGVVLTSVWLQKQGYSNGLLRNYRKSNWLKAIGQGAMIRNNDKVDYLGAIHAIQNQLSLSIHPASNTALSLVGKLHFLEINPTKIYLFGQENESLPAWFKKGDWGVVINYYSSSFLPKDMGMIMQEHKNFSIKVASPARALMESLYLAPQILDLMDCYEIMKGLTNISPKLVQELLENCSSVKVKRLFLYFAEKSGHNWFFHLITDRIDLGEGIRSIANNGVYISKYKITVPKSFEINEYPKL